MDEPLDARARHRAIADLLELLTELRALERQVVAFRDRCAWTRLTEHAQDAGDAAQLLDLARRKLAGQLARLLPEVEELAKGGI